MKAKVRITGYLSFVLEKLKHLGVKARIYVSTSEDLLILVSWYFRDLVGGIHEEKNSLDGLNGFP